MRSPQFPDLATVDYDTAALKGAAVVGHRMDTTGTWRLSVGGGRARRGETWTIRVVDGAPSMLAIERAAEAAAFGGSVRQGTVRPGGYVRLRSPAAAGAVFARLFAEGQDDPVWDSRQLVADDYFVCMPMRPGRYGVANQLGGATAELVIRYPDPRRIAKDQPLDTAPIRIRVGESFEPARFEIDPGQALVFQVAVKAQIALTLAQADDGPQDLAAWRAQHDEVLLSRLGSRPANSA